MSANVEHAFIAQLLDAPSGETRRTLITSEAFAGATRDLYRAIVSVSTDHPTVSVEAVCVALREAGRLDAVGGRDAVERITEHTGMYTVDGARADLVDAATRRLLMEAGKRAHGAARDGQTRDASEAMQDALRVVSSMRGSAESIQLKTMRDHLTNWAKRVMDAKDQPPRVKLGAFESELGEHSPGMLGLLYGFSQSGKSHMMQYLERQYAEAGFVTLRVSCEDPDRINEGRLMSEAAGVDATKPRDLDAETFVKINRAIGLGSTTWDRRIVVEHPASVEVICHTMRKAASEMGATVAFVDYAQLLRVQTHGKNATAEERLTLATQDLKETAKEVGMQVWLGSQVTVRDPKKNYKPSPFDLKGARSLYEKADNAIALWVEDGKRYAEIQKNKMGMSNVMAQQMVGPAGMVMDLQRVQYEQREDESGQFKRGGRMEFSDDYNAGRGW